MTGCKKKHFKENDNLKIPRVHDMMGNLRSATKGLDDRVAFRDVVAGAWGKAAPGSDCGGAETPLASLTANRCFWQSPFFQTATPATQNAVIADGAAGSATPDQHHVISEMALPDVPYTTGDSTNWEGVFAIGAGIGNMGGVEYQPVTSSNPFGHYNRAHASMAGRINLNGDDATTSPFQKAYAVNRKKVLVSAHWQIGFGLTWGWQPSILLPWRTGGSDGFVGVQGDIIMSLVEVGKPENNRVVEKMFLFRWASADAGVNSDDMGQSLFIHNQNVSVPERISASMEVGSDEVSVGIGIRINAWREGPAPSGGADYFAGADFGLGSAAVPSSLVRKPVWPAGLTPDLGPIRVFPVCYGQSLVPQVVKGID